MSTFSHAAPVMQVPTVIRLSDERILFADHQQLLYQLAHAFIIIYKGNKFLFWRRDSQKALGQRSYFFISVRCSIAYQLTLQVKLYQM